MFGHHPPVVQFRPTPASIPPHNVKYRMKLPPGLPVNITPLNPISFLLRAALIQPEKVAIRHPDAEFPVEYTFAVWAQRIQNFAYSLLSKGIKPGDRVAVIAPNCPMIAEAHHAILAARAICLCINIRLPPADIEYILSHSGAKIVFIDYEQSSLLDSLKLAPGVEVVVSHDTGRFGCPYEEFLTQGRTWSDEKGWEGLELESSEEKGCALNYTSGTTGRPKGVLTTYRGSYLAAIANAYESRLQSDSVYLWIVPMFHCSGWTYPWACTFAQCTQITTRYVRIPVMWKHFLHSGVTHYGGAPTVQLGVVNAPEAHKLPKDRPISVTIAGAAPTATLISQMEALGFKVIHVYGLTETYGPFTRNFSTLNPATHSLPLAQRAKLMARQGHSFVNADEVRVAAIHHTPGHEHEHGGDRGDTVVDVPDDGETVGEVVIRGNIVMKEYFKDAEATHKAFRGGYFGSGDLAVRNPDGSISIKDRSKDLIISGGENASSLAIEQELAAHPDILEVSVVARPHPKWGERAMVYVILHPHSERKWRHRGAEFEENLKAFAKGRLPGFACPEWVEIVQELPKTSTGKIKKHVLRKRAAKL